MAPPEIISRSNNRIIQRPFGFFFVGGVMGAGSFGCRGGSSMFSTGGAGAPGSGGMPGKGGSAGGCLLYTSPSPRDKRQSRMPSSA